jgi:hypothetical protein
MNHQMNVAACKSCAGMSADSHQGMVPCMQAHHQANSAGHPVFLVTPEERTGKPCCCSDDLPDMAQFLLHYPGNTACMDQLSRNVGKLLSERLKKYMQGDSLRYAATDGAREFVGYYKEPGQAVYRPEGAGKAGYMVFWAQPNDKQFLEFLRVYRDHISARAAYSRGEKYALVLWVAAGKTKGEMGKMIREMLSGENVVKAIGVFALFGGFMTAAMAVGGIAKALAAIVSVGLNASDAYTCALLLKQATEQTEAAGTDNEIEAAGVTFGKFFAMLSFLIVPAVLGAACGRLLHWFTKERPAAWKKLGHEVSVDLNKQYLDAAKHQEKPMSKVGQHPHDPLARIAARLPTEFEAASGMWSHHLRPLKEFAREKNAFFVARCGNVESMPYHFNELVTGKPMDIKWKTAHEGPHKGLVVAPDWKTMGKDGGPTTAADWKKFMHVCEVLKQKGYHFKPAPKEGRLPEPGALVLGSDGRAFCSDVDKMGMYTVKDGHAVDHNLAQDFNDHPALVKTLNDKVYKSIEMDQHPGQDFFIVGVDGNGHPIMGLQPKVTEKFLVVMGDKKPPRAFVVGIHMLKEMYQEYGIRWPYNVP